MYSGGGTRWAGSGIFIYRGALRSGTHLTRGRDIVILAATLVSRDIAPTYRERLAPWPPTMSLRHLSPRHGAAPAVAPCPVLAPAPTPWQPPPIPQLLLGKSVPTSWTADKHALPRPMPESTSPGTLESHHSHTGASPPKNVVGAHHPLRRAGIATGTFSIASQVLANAFVFCSSGSGWVHRVTTRARDSSPGTRKSPEFSASPTLETFCRMRLNKRRLHVSACRCVFSKLRQAGAFAIADS